jgi:hypothetical protein
LPAAFFLTRRADQQNALRYPAAQLRESTRGFHELDDFNQLLLRLVDAGDVLEGHVQLVLNVNLRFVFAESNEARLLGAHLFNEEVPDAHKQDQRKEPRKNVAEECRFNFPFKNDFVLVEQRGQFRINADGSEGFGLARLFAVRFHFALDLIGRHGHFDDFAVLEKVEEPAVRYHLRGEHGRDVTLNNQNNPHAHKDIPDGKPLPLFHVSPPIAYLSKIPHPDASEKLSKNFNLFGPTAGRVCPKSVFLAAPLRLGRV